MRAGRGRLQGKTTVAGPEANEERNATEEIASRYGGSIVVGLQQWCRRLRRLPRRQDARRSQEGIPVKRFVRVQLTAPDERRPEVGQRQELTFVRAVVQDRRRSQSGKW